MGNLCRAYVHVSIALRQTKASIRPLQKALLTLDLPSYQLTPLHACLTLMCVHSQCYFAAMPLVEETMLEMNPEVHFVIVADILKYFYYGGMAFLGMKKYQQAVEFFKMAITLPAKQLSLIMVEAYKKYILVSAILFYQPVSAYYIILTSIVKTTGLVIGTPSSHVSFGSTKYQRIL